MAKENCFVFMEEGGAGRAVIAKASSRKEAEKNIRASIGRKVRFAKGATKDFREQDLWTQPFSQEQTLNGIKFEDRAALVRRFFVTHHCEEIDDGIQDPPPNRFIYEGPYGKVCIAFNDRTIEWEAYCYPEGADGREVILPLVATSKKLAEREAIAVLRDEATHHEEIVQRATPEEAAAAVRTLIRYAGDNPDREGLLDTPRRVVKSFDELFKGYNQSAWEVLTTSFSETGTYDEMVLLTDIEFESHCEHHMVPFVGRAHIAYFSKQKVIGISKLARLVEVYSRRLQIQEKMTTQIADNLNIVLEPKGVAVVIEAQHMCMTMRGVQKKTVKMVTSCMTGIFRKDAKMKSEFLAMIGSPRSGQA